VSRIDIVFNADLKTRCCVTTTVRECHDRGFECCVLSDCTGGFDAQQVTTSLDTVCGQDGLFGFVGHSSDFFAAVSKSRVMTPPSTPPAAEDAFLSIPQLQLRYKSGLLTPEEVINSVFDRIEKYEKVDSAVWISKQSREEALSAARALNEKFSGKPSPPLYGVPFGLKDNIDVKDVVTTATCEAYAYTAKSTASAVQLLLDAGALYIGKLNMDQLATGLSGCRSPYGTPHSVYSSEYISGGSSSGSAVAVAAGLVSFTLGTDTAGSGRVPAAFNGIVGYKPTKGTISARGVVPACKSLDTLSIMAPTLAEARKVWFIIDQYDSLDPFAKKPLSLSLWKQEFRGYKEGGFTFGVPSPSVIQTCSKEYQELFEASVQKLRSCGGRLVNIDYTPFEKAADLLYDASLVHERIAGIGHDFLISHLSSLHPTTKALFEAALSSPLKPWNVYHDQALQVEYTRQAQLTFDTLEGGVDVLLVPSTPCHPTIKEMEEEPLQLNAKVGTFTHAGNVVDLCGVSVNAGFVQKDGVKLPFGVTFLGGSGYDGKILDIVAVFEDAVRSERK
jgi:allophanate hydrolase